MQINSVEDLANIINVSILDSGFRAILIINDKNIEDLIEGEIPYDILIEFLNSKNINFGLNEVKLREICEKPNEFIGIEEEIARGVLPTDGKNGWIDWKIKTKTNETPTLLEDGRVDYYNLNKIINIKKGDFLAAKIASTEGIPGKSVFNKEIIAKKGKEALLKAGKNVILNPNKDKLYAGIDGQLTITDKDKVNIFPIYEVVGDVDFGIGNIDFVGTVIVKGNVPEGFKIKADGEIKIYGNVDGGDLLAGGDILVQHGIIGHNKSIIETKGKLTASFILDSEIIAANEVIVSKSIMHSNISAGNSVICKNDKGFIVGGEIRATNSIVANSIGNEHTTVTVVEVGVNPELKSRLTEVRKEKKDLDLLLDKVEKGLLIFDKLESSGVELSIGKLEVREELFKQRLVISQKIDVNKKIELDLDDKMKEIKSAYVEVKNIIYPGVKVIIGKNVKYIKEEINYAKFVLDDTGEISNKK